MLRLMTEDLHSEESTEASETENILARTLLPLPLDQRYSTTDMQRIVRLILG